MAMEELPAEYRHEPDIALAGGDDGLDAVRIVLAKAPQFLAPEGLLVVEIGHNRAAAEKAFPRLPFTWPSTDGGDDSVLLLRRDELVAGA
jgi:ribosomal protein L3 glutamine methyltransferase